MKYECTMHGISVICLNFALPVVESNPNKFKIDELEISERKSFISRTKKTIKVSVL